MNKKKKNLFSIILEKISNIIKNNLTIKNQEQLNNDKEKETKINQSELTNKYKEIIKDEQLEFYKRKMEIQELEKSNVITEKDSIILNSASQYIYLKKTTDLIEKMENDNINKNTIENIFNSLGDSNSINILNNKSNIVSEVENSMQTHKIRENIDSFEEMIKHDLSNDNDFIKYKNYLINLTNETEKAKNKILEILDNYNNKLTEIKEIENKTNKPQHELRNIIENKSMSELAKITHDLNDKGASIEQISQISDFIENSIKDKLNLENPAEYILESKTLEYYGIKSDYKDYCKDTFDRDFDLEFETKLKDLYKPKVKEYVSNELNLEGKTLNEVKERFKEFLLSKNEFEEENAMAEFYYYENEYTKTIKWLEYKENELDDKEENDNNKKQSNKTNDNIDIDR